jgi:GntR family transcriptional regulator
MTRDPRPEALDRTSALPLWAQLYEDVRHRLHEGEFTDGFPSEMELVRAYQVSRNTVRQAMRRLRADGSVVAERGRRPRLAGSGEIEQPLGALYSLFASVEASGLEQRSEVRALGVVVDPEAATQLGCERSAPLVHLERLRLAGSDPLALDRIWVPYDIGGRLLEVDFTHTAFYDELLRHAGVAVSSGWEKIRAVVPAEVERRALALPTGAAALVIDRLGRWRGRSVEWRRTLVRGDRFSLIADFSPRQGYRLGPGSWLDERVHPPGWCPPQAPDGALHGPGSKDD